MYNFSDFCFSIADKNKIILNKELLNESKYQSQNILQLENAKLIGNDKNNRPYIITAKSSFKNNLHKNIIFLYSVEADMTLNNNSWILLHTKHASFDIIKKIINAEEKTFIFYDDGTKLESTKLNYNINDGIGHGSNGVKMFGEWGLIEASSFSFNTNNSKINFYNKPKLILN